MAGYVGSGGNKALSEGYIGVNGVNRKVAEGWVGTASGNRLIYQAGTQLGDLPVGTIVKIGVNGTLRNHIVVHQGLPSPLYDASCDGAWMLTEDIYETREWNSVNDNRYANSTVHQHLISSVLPMWDLSIRNRIMQAKIPYGAGGGDESSHVGAQGLSAKMFLLAAAEVGVPSSQMGRPADGALLLYFIEGIGDEAASAKRLAFYEGNAAAWWLRSPVTSGSERAFRVAVNGTVSNSYTVNVYGLRPAFILPSSTPVNDDLTIT